MDCTRTQCGRQFLHLVVMYHCSEGAVIVYRWLKEHYLVVTTEGNNSELLLIINSQLMNEWWFNYLLSQPATISSTNDKISVLRNTHHFPSYFHLFTTLHLAGTFLSPLQRDTNFHSTQIPYPPDSISPTTLLCSVSHLPSLLPKGTHSYSWSSRPGLTRQTLD